MAEQTSTGTFQNVYKFNGKELDAESGLYYYGARYYDPRSSVWLSVDPLMEKYGWWTPYNYTLANPVKFIDPDGRRVIIANNTTKKFFKQYLIDQFGTDKIFRINSYGEVRVNKRQYAKYLKTATNAQKKLLIGIINTIGRTKTAKIYINENSDKFHFDEPVSREGTQTYFGMNTDNSGFTQESISNNGYYIIGINNQRASDEKYTSGNTVTKIIGKDDPIQIPEYTGESASAVFFYELLDEFLNFFVDKIVKDASPKAEVLDYHDTALENQSKPKRDGSEHQ